MVEVFEDQAPLAARHLINRCREGTTDTLQLTYVHRLLPDMAMFFGTSLGCAPLGLSALNWLHAPLQLRHLLLQQ